MSPPLSSFDPPLKKLPKKTNSGEPSPGPIPLSFSSNPLTIRAEEASREPSLISIPLSSSHPLPKKTNSGEPSPTSIPLHSSGPLPNKTQEDSGEPSSTSIPLYSSGPLPNKTQEDSGEPSSTSIPLYSSGPLPNKTQEDSGEPSSTPIPLSDPLRNKIHEDSGEEAGDQEPSVDKGLILNPNLGYGTYYSSWEGVEHSGKSIQDVYCELSPVQLKMYEQEEEIYGAREEYESTIPSYVYGAIEYLLKLCSHPLLVIGDKVPESLSPLMSELFPGAENVISELHDLRHSPKLIALRVILECHGIGAETASSSEGIIGSGKHRVLIFAQHKAFLDLIERDLFNGHMKNLTYLRMDHSLSPQRQSEIVHTFNSDPRIDALLLTTHVVGLGWKTSADTLVFTEHDWSPKRDYRAIDRADKLCPLPRITSVYRLIMRGTLEESVMKLERFNESDIRRDNSGMGKMRINKLVHLLDSSRKS